MVKLIFLSISTLIFVTAPMTQASVRGAEEQIQQSKPVVMKKLFENPLVAAELPFIEHSKTMFKKPDWPRARENLLNYAGGDSKTFKRQAYEYLRIKYDNLDKLGIEELYRQYAELYQLLSAPAPQPAAVTAVIADHTPRSRSDSEGSASDLSALSVSFTDSEPDSDGSASAGPQFTDADADNDGPPLGSSASESDPAEFDNLFTTDGSQPEARPLLGGLRHRYLSSSPAS